MGKRALVVVDEGPVVSDLIQAVLKSAGMECVTLTKGTDAPALLGNESFGMLVLDLRTLTDALALARLARESGFNSATPIILMSDDQSTAAVAAGFEAGVSFFLYKPVDEARLIKLVQATSDAAGPKKRRFRRVPLQSRVHLAFAQRELEAETIDVSLNGMLVRAQGHFPAGSAVRISLYVSPEAQPIVGSGYVMRTLAGNRMAIQLDRLSPAETGRLQDFLLPLTLGPTAGAAAASA
ncbi:MAG TPA: response regulator [Candidatus Acidoferrales bacterium]|jgi:DNA-binding response OmpR family regulator|nr:response regulator [Candidatus Acidoferrales bacterium]